MEEIIECVKCGSIPETGNGFIPLESTTYCWCSNPSCDFSPIGKGERLFTIVEWNGMEAYADKTYEEYLTMINKED